MMSACYRDLVKRRCVCDNVTFVKVALVRKVRVFQGIVLLVRNKTSGPSNEAQSAVQISADTQVSTQGTSL